MSEKRAEKIKEAGEFRAIKSTGGKFTRGFKPRFEANVRQVGSIDGNEVSDTSGNRFLTRFVQPVEAKTADAGPVRIEQSGSVQTKQKQIKILQPYADGLKLHLDIMGKVPGPRVLAILKEMRGQAAFKSAIAEARLNKISLLQNLVALFPSMFNTEK